MGWEYVDCICVIHDSVEGTCEHGNERSSYQKKGGGGADGVLAAQECGNAKAGKDEDGECNIYAVQQDTQSFLMSLFITYVSSTCFGPWYVVIQLVKRS